MVGSVVAAVADYFWGGLRDVAGVVSPARVKTGGRIRPNSLSRKNNLYSCPDFDEFVDSLDRNPRAHESPKILLQGLFHRSYSIGACRKLAITASCGVRRGLLCHTGPAIAGFPVG